MKKINDQFFIFGFIFLLMFFSVSRMSYGNDGDEIEYLKIANRWIHFCNEGKLKSREGKKLIDEKYFKQTPECKLQFPKANKVIGNGKSFTARVSFPASGKELDLDLYLHFHQKEKDWKLWQIDSLVHMMEAAIFEANLEIERLKDKPNKTPEEENQLKFYLSEPVLKKSFEEDLPRMKITFSSDENIKKYFLDNKEKFKILKKLFEEKSDSPELKTLKKDLLLVSVEWVTRGENTPAEKTGEIFFSFGGMLDNTVGFVYSPFKKPKLNDEYQYIWIEEIIPNWFLYKTT